MREKLIDLAGFEIKSVLHLLSAEIKEEDIVGFAEYLYDAMLAGKRIWVCGNGGSALIGSHFTSDLMNLGFDAKCMVDNVARTTALTNDYGWPHVYTLQMEKHYREGDLLILISVHGSTGKGEGEAWSTNLANAADLARKKGGVVLSLSGCEGGSLKQLSDHGLYTSCSEAYLVEGLHSVLAHLVCSVLREMIE